MHNSSSNLKILVEHLAINQNEMARSLEIDPSLVCRWISGQRNLKITSPQMDGLVEYILNKCMAIDDIEWLKQQFVLAKLPDNNWTINGVKQNLIIWLAKDGELLLKNIIEGQTTHSKESLSDNELINNNNYNKNTVSIGHLEITMALKQLLTNTKDSEALSIFLSNDQIGTILNEDIVNLIKSQSETKNFKITLLICVSANTQAISKIINAYLRPLILGNIQLMLVYGVTQTVTDQMHFIIGNKTVMLVTEIPNNNNLVVASVISESNFVSETLRSFNETLRFSKQVLTVYGDDFTRNIIDILYVEFATPGNLDVIKDSINPLYMNIDQYTRYL